MLLLEPYFIWLYEQYLTKNSTQRKTKNNIMNTISKDEKPANPLTPNAETMAREDRLKPTGLHFIFVNPKEPSRPPVSWGTFLSWWRMRNFFVDWWGILLFKCGRESRWGQGFNPLSGFAVCLTEEAIRKEEAVWLSNGFITFRVDFTLADDSNRGTLSEEEQSVLKFLVQTGRNIEDEGGSGKATSGFFHFRGQDMWQLMLKGIKAERIWRAWLRSGGKGPRVVKAY